MSGALAISLVLEWKILRSFILLYSKALDFFKSFNNSFNLF